MTYQHLSPTYKITLNEQDITERINPRLVSLTLTEKRAYEADELSLTLTDFDGKLELPRKGVTLALSLGYRNQALIKKGLFIVDEIEYSGPPDQVTLRARSSQFNGALSRNREESWHKKTIAEIIETIASRNALKNRIDDNLAQKLIEHIDQTSESDIAFIARLGRMYDAVATIKNETLIFLSTSNTKLSKGKTLEPLTIDRKDTQSFTYTQADRESYTGVKAYYVDMKTAERKSELVGEENNAKELPDLYESQKAALDAAEGEWQTIQRSIATMSINLSQGRPDIMPQTPLYLRGFKNGIGEVKWLTVSVSHNLGDGGLLSSLELEQCSLIA